MQKKYSLKTSQNINNHYKNSSEEQNFNELLFRI